MRSCGCAKGEHIRQSITIHGMSGTGIYEVWSGMRKRCLNPADNLYPYYGGRGITICERWSSFAAFLHDMGPRPAGLSLDRKDNDGPYSPDNCRWATRSQQSRNKRDTVMVVYRGVHMPLAEAAEHAGLSSKLIHARITKHWAEDRLFLPPLAPHERINAKANRR